MGWLQSVSDVTRGKPGKSESIPDSGGAAPLKSVSGKQASAPPHDWYAPLPEPPDFLRAEPAVREAERFVRSRRGGTPLTVKNIKNALNRARRPGGEP
jgi:hypothetical protein